MIIAPLVSALLAAGADVAAAQRHYDQARYEESLAALGPSCTGAADPTACERLRAFVLIASGREDEARAAFARLLTLTPDAELGDDVAPKLRNVFAAVKRELGTILGAVLEPVVVRDAERPWGLALDLDQTLPVTGVRAYVRLEGATTAREVVLQRSGLRWSGQLSGHGGAKSARYHLVVELQGGVEVTVGSELAPRALALREGGGAGGSVGGSGSVVDSDAFRMSDSQGARARRDDHTLLPVWAWWAIGGGAAVLAGVVVAILVTRDDAPGAVQVQIVFDGE